MKTPGEIKYGLHCLWTDCSCKDCGYDENGCVEQVEKDALAYIEQLEDQIRDLTKKVQAQSGTDMNVPRWISVEERLPEKHGQLCVGLYNQHGAAPRTMLFPYIFTWHAYGDNGYVNGPHFSDEGLDGLKVWYWMPLPEAPKEGTHGND